VAGLNGRKMIELRDLRKALGGREVLRSVNLEVYEGETLVIIGRSGEGKSVLLKHIMGLMRPDAGAVLIEGEDITQLKEKEMYRVREKLGMLFQGAALFDSLSVLHNVGFALYEHSQLSEDEIRQRVIENLRRVQLEDILDKKPAELSGGMKKRVGLARAIAGGPKIILYDEPTTGLDPITADAINDLILSMREQLKVTSVAVTHDMASAYKVADRIAMLFRGEIIAVGSVEEIQNSSNPYVQQFIRGEARGPITD